MNLKLLLILCFVVVAPLSSFGQSSFLQDGKGESSLKIFDNEIAINTSNESLSIQYFFRKDTDFSVATNSIARKIEGDESIKQNETFYPADYKKVWEDIAEGKINLQNEFDEFPVKVKEEIKRIINSKINRDSMDNGGLAWSTSLKFTANQGVSKLFDGGNFVPQIDAGITLGLNEVPDFSSDNKVVLRYGYVGAAIQRSEFKLFDETAMALDDKEFIGFTINGGYNIIGEWKGASGPNSVTLFGFGLKAGRFNTFDDLKKVETSTMTTLNDDTILLESITPGFKGDYKTYYGMNLLADGYIFPSGWNNRVGLGSYARYNAIGNTPRLNFGLGAVVTKDKKPTNVVLSLMFQFSDVFNDLEEEDSVLFDRFGINLIAGYKL